MMGFRTRYPKLWHPEYFKLKKSEKTAEHKGCSDPIPTLSSQKQVIKSSRQKKKNPHVRGALRLSGGKEHPYLQRQKDTKKHPNKQALLSFLLLTTMSHTP